MTTFADEVVRGPVPLERIIDLHIGPAYRVKVRFGDGAEAEADLGALVAGSPLFAPLGDPATFAAARLVDGGAGIEWPGEIDYSAGALRRLALAQSCPSQVLPGAEQAA